MNNQELWEIVNPVFNTAKSCVQLDAAAGDEDSKQLLEALGFEPFGSQISKKPVPPEIHEQVMRLFHTLNEEGNTIIMITHDPKIASHASRIVRILDGEISEGALADA